MGVAKDRGFSEVRLEHQQDAALRRRPTFQTIAGDRFRSTISARARLAYRPRETFVIRGGYGINYDPQPLAFIREPARHLSAIARIWLHGVRERERPGRGRLSDGFPPEPVPDTTSGVHRLRFTTGFFAPPDKSRWGYISRSTSRSRRSCRGGFIGQAGYVGTRQRDILQTHGRQRRTGARAGSARAPLFQKFGTDRRHRSSSATSVGTTTIRCRATLTAASPTAVQFNRRLYVVEGHRDCCDDLSDKNQAMQIPGLLRT